MKKGYDSGNNLSSWDRSWNPTDEELMANEHTDAILLWLTPAKGHGWACTCTFDGRNFNATGSRETAPLRVLTLLALEGIRRPWMLRDERGRIASGAVTCHGRLDSETGEEPRVTWHSDPQPIPGKTAAREALAKAAGKVSSFVRRYRDRNGKERAYHTVTGQALPDNPVLSQFMGQVIVQRGLARGHFEIRGGTVVTRSVPRLRGEYGKWRGHYLPKHHNPIEKRMVDRIHAEEIREMGLRGDDLPVHELDFEVGNNFRDQARRKSRMKAKMGALEAVAADIKNDPVYGDSIDQYSEDELRREEGD